MTSVLPAVVPASILQVGVFGRDDERYRGDGQYLLVLAVIGHSAPTVVGWRYLGSAAGLIAELLDHVRNNVPRIGQRPKSMQVVAARLLGTSPQFLTRYLHGALPGLEALRWERLVFAHYHPQETLRAALPRFCRLRPPEVIRGGS